MVFSSLTFIFIFLPIFLLIYYGAKPKYRNLVIFVASLIFYGIGIAGNPLYIVLFMVSIGVNYLIGIEMMITSKRKRLLIAGIGYNFFWLLLFKYASFFFSGFIKLPELVLPLGISFYTFQMVSYIIDVYRKETKPEPSFVTMGAYISMFPQLIAGPIVTYKTVRNELHRERLFSVTQFAEGIMTFTVGLGLKVLLANQIGNLWENIQNIGFENISTQLAWLGAFGFSFQLYFDFWGYSLMAIGLGKMVGIRLPENFNHPYTAVSMTDFWRRWHITLGQWFRNYLYIPLGGNRTSKTKWIRNLFIVWMFTGLWHGAGFNFLLWGFVLFVILLCEKLLYGKQLERRPWFGHIYMFFLIPLTWTIFKITDLSQLAIYFQRLFPFFDQTERYYYAGDYLRNLSEFKFVLAGCVLFSTRLPMRIIEKMKNHIYGFVIFIAIFWASLYCLFMGMNDPFLYFRF